MGGHSDDGMSIPRPAEKGAGRRLHGDLPALPGCVSYGATVDEPCVMSREAIAFYIEDVIEFGEPIP